MSGLELAKLDKEEAIYPRWAFCDVLTASGPYCFYLRQWIQYDGVRLKMYHDIKTFDGVVHESCYPNGDSFYPDGGGEVKDSDVEFIRLSVNQFE